MRLKMRLAIDLQADGFDLGLVAALLDNRGDRAVTIVVPESQRGLIIEVRRLLSGRHTETAALRVWAEPAAGGAALAAARKAIHAAVLADTGANVVLSLSGLATAGLPVGKAVAGLPIVTVLDMQTDQLREPDWEAKFAAIARQLGPLDCLILPDELSAARAHACGVTAAGAINGAEGKTGDRKVLATAILQRCDAVCLPDQKIPRAQGRPRLAMVAPLPPLQTGIAEYVMQLLGPLSRHYEIELVTEHTATVDLPAGMDFAVHSPTWLRAHASEIDRVLYHFGNHPMHRFMFGLLRDIPGVVVLHDFFLLDGRCATLSPVEVYDIILHNQGLRALLEAKSLDLARLDGWPYPGNLDVLQRATAIIVHGEEPCRLADDWYGLGTSREWHQIPLLRQHQEPETTTRDEARARLGLNHDVLLLCCFGRLGTTKLNHRVLEALAQSRLASDPRVHIVFVGDAEENYRARLDVLAQALPAARYRITGWVDGVTYADYLKAADIAIQLRGQSRGETSASLLDCLVNGLPTIVNANPGMCDLDPGAVVLIPDLFECADLQTAIEELAGNPAGRTVLGRHAQAFAVARHSPFACADAYHIAIEAAASARRSILLSLPDKIAELSLEASDKLRIAEALASNFPAEPLPRTLFVDVTDIVVEDTLTGIQRVVRSITRALLSRDDLCVDVLPVWLDPKNGYRAAIKYAERLFGRPASHLDEQMVDVGPGDVFLVLDLVPYQNTQRRELFEKFRDVGAEVWHVVYDLLPVQLPQYFPDGVEDSFREWLSIVKDGYGAACISQAVANDLAAWLAEHSPAGEVMPRIGWFHLGADFENSFASRGLPDDKKNTLERLNARPTFLMVGTVEPRKGHRQALEAFERLWHKGVDVNLAIVGKQGWQVEALSRRLRAHREAGERLFWFELISDEYLEELYASVSCLILASEGEGFGLPLIEAARYRLPILVRDLPVFREVAGDHALYFSGLEPEALADGVECWLLRQAAGRTISSTGIVSQSWHDSAANLLCLLGISPGPTFRKPP